MLATRVITAEQALRAIAPQWNRLLQASGSDSFFLTWEWIDTWWEVYGRGRAELCVIVAEEGDDLVGVAPLMIVRGGGALGRLQRELQFIGQSSDVRPEYLDFFVVRGRERELIPALCAPLTGPLRGRWDFLLFETVLGGSANLPLIEAALGGRGVTLTPPRKVPSYYSELSGSMDDFLRAKSTHFRKRINYNRNRLAREGEVRYRFAAVDVSVAEAFDGLVRLNHERWGVQGTSFRSESYVRFHRALCERIEPLGWLLLVLMTVGDRVVAAKYDYCYGAKVWGNQGGWSKEHEKLEVGSLLIARLFEWAIARQLREYDFLGGEAEYKERWGTGVREMVDLEAFNATARGHAVRLAQHGKELLRRRIPAETWERLKALRDKLPF